MPPRHRPRLVRLELGEWGRDVVEVVEELYGDRYHVRFKSGTELIVPISVTSNRPTEEAQHDRPTRQRHRAQAADVPQLDDELIDIGPDGRPYVRRPQ